MNKMLLILALLFLWSCDPFDTIIEDNPNPVTYYEAVNLKAIEPGSSMKVATWNIKFGGGRIDFFFDCFGDRSLMEEPEVVANMDAVAAKITEINPDVIFLQEADVDAKRSAYVDEVQYILDHTDLNYGVYASQWKADYVPSDGIGRMNSGNAILSKYKLSDAERIALPLIGEQSGLVQYFYLRRNLLKVTVHDAQNKEIVLLGTHTSAFAHDGTKGLQLEKIKTQIDNLKSNGKAFLLGGDFNSLPPQTAQLKDFPDDVCPKDSDFSTNDFSAEGDIMLPFYEYNPLIALDVYGADNAPYFSFTADKNGFWNRKLDYMFTNAVLNDGKVHQEGTMSLSDHAPLSGVFSGW